MKSRKVRKAAKHKAFVSKKQLRGNIPLNTNASDSDADVDEDALMYDPKRKQELSSDEEAFDNDSSEEEEVLPITDEEEEDDDDDDDDDDEEDEAGASEDDEDEEEEKYDEEAGLPSREAWGRKKSTYYNADFVDKDRGKTYREEDEAEAKGEEEEALFIQRNFLKLIGGEDKVPELSTEDIEKEKHVEENFASLDKAGKLKFLKKKYPEMILLINEFKDKMSEILNRISPMLDLLKTTTVSESASLYIKYKYHVLLQYCTNINFYMYLKSMGGSTENHPVLDRIKEFKVILDRLNKSGETAEKQIDTILQKLQKKETLSFNKNAQRNTTKKIKASNGEIQDEDVEDEQMNVDADATDEKRMITYEIAKNKGLTVKRKKEYRNPRVHNRMKFKRAKVRRKGQVRGVLREVKKYDGEPTGISTHVVRSIKIK